MATGICLSSQSLTTSRNKSIFSTESVSPGKKDQITALLCGRLSGDAAYRMSGPGCVGKSVTKRSEDTAIQIHSYRLCGYQKFAEELRVASVRAMGFMESLSVCTSERIDVRSILDDRMKYVAGRTSGMKCDDSLRRQLTSRRPALEAMISSRADPTSEALQGLGLQIDAAGNVSEPGKPTPSRTKVDSSNTPPNQSTPRFIRAFNTVCIGVDFSEEGFAEIISMFESTQELTGAMLAASGGGKAGYSFVFEGDEYIAKLAEKLDGSFRSRSCVLTFRSASHQSVLKSIQQSFNTHELGSEHQGGYTFSFLQVDLVGYTTKIGMSIQSGEGMASVSMFEMP